MLLLLKWVLNECRVWLWRWCQIMQ
jgi:hypothetical protein